MAGIYVGSTAGYSGKNMVIMGLGLKFQKEGYKVGYYKPVGAMPKEVAGKLGDEDANFVQGVLGLEEDPTEVTPVLVTQDFKVKAFSGQCEKPHGAHQIRIPETFRGQGRDPGGRVRLHVFGQVLAAWTAWTWSRI